MGVGILTGHETRDIKKLESDLKSKFSKEDIVSGTEDEINDKIKNKQIPDGAFVYITDDTDIDNHYTKEEVDTLLKKGAGYNTTVDEDGYAHAEGYSTSATGVGSHAEGFRTIANTDYAAHAEGWDTEATGSYAHAEGAHTKATADVAHAEGWYTEATGNNSHTEGQYTVASELDSHAQGFHTTASNFSSHAGGRYNVEMINGGQLGNTGTAFVIGNGTSDTAKRNALSLLFNGTLKTSNTISSSVTADYAEYFEWEDGNINNEDRVGKFVTLNGDKIRIANNTDEYILGVVSGAPFVLGNGDCDVWNGMILRDEYKRPLLDPVQKMEKQPITNVTKKTYILADGSKKIVEQSEIVGEEYKPVFDEDGNPVYIGYTERMNPDYDSSQEYKSRNDRPEWDAIGMLGVLPVTHDGSLVVNKYATVNEDGIATACEKSHDNSYRVINIISDNVAEIIFR